MRPLLLLTLSLLTASTLAAQSDLSVTASVVGIPHYTARTELAVVVTNAGPAAATNVLVTSTAGMDGDLDARCAIHYDDATGAAETRCTVASLAVGESTTFRPLTGSHSSVQPLVIPLRVSAAQEDPNLANNETTLLFDYVDQHDAAVAITAPATLGPDRTATARIAFTNRTQYGTEPATLTFYVTQLERLVTYSPGLSCSVLPAGVPNSFSTITCQTPPVAANSTTEYAFELQFVRESRVAFSATVLWGGNTYHDYKEQTYTQPFPVTNTNDAGPGSLRQALLNVNATCLSELHACRVEFALTGEPSPGGWYIFRPLTPLPEITGNWIVVDGESQSRLANTNSAGPEIFLDGGTTAGVSGLTFLGRRAEVVGMAIGNFERHGVYMEFTGLPNSSYVGNYLVARNYLGVDPAGAAAAPNGSRGVMIMSGSAEIDDNVLSGNVRSGIYFSGLNAAIRRNRIGVAAASDAPVPNGASGIFVGRHSRGYSASGITGNVIAHNADMGIALAADAVAVIGQNRIFSNRQGGIDIQLDGPTVDFPAGGSPAVPATPIIQSAFFDGTATIIEGIGILGGAAGSAFSHPLNVSLYANEELDYLGFAEGEQYLGEATVATSTLRFRLRVEADLRGRWITGVTLQHSSFFGGEWTELSSSEFSRPVKVE